MKGLRQGDALACLLFNIALEKAVRESRIQVGHRIFNHSVQLLAYADDVDIVGRSQRTVREAFQAIVIPAKRLGLEVNQSKTKYLVTEEAPGRNVTVKFGKFTFEHVSNFKYLGSKVTHYNRTEVEIKRKIMSTNQCYFSLRKQLSGHILSRKSKLHLYKTVIRPVLTYGSEAWTITKNSEHNLLVFEWKILQRIFGGVVEDGTWRRRTNREIYDSFKELNVLQVIKLGQLRWAGLWLARAKKNYQGCY